jgi:DNA repair exonuclease SbcCD nuclease subunit
MKFLHTADWQIGMRAAHVGARAEDVRAARLDTAKAVVDVARQRSVEAILLAGDTFEDNEVSGADVQRIADILDAFGGPVYIIPGNHDPFVQASVWNHSAWKRERLHLLLAAEPVSIVDGVTLYPCPALSKHSTADPTSWIAEAPADGVRIGIAHGTVRGSRPDEECFPIARDAAERTGLDYLALGHWHSTASFDCDLEHARMAYCGTPETTRFDERDSGNTLLVDVVGRNQLPNVEQISTGRLQWKQLERSIGAEVDVETLVADVEAIERPEATLVKLRLHGLLQPRDVVALGRLRELIDARFPLCARLDDSGLLAAPQDASWFEALPAGLLQSTARKLLEGTDPNAAATALQRLYRFAHDEHALGEAL